MKKLELDTIEQILLLVIVLCSCTASFLVGRTSMKHDWSQAPAINDAEPYSVWLPTPKELQGIIMVEPDGIFGPKTMKSWTEYCGNYYGIKYYLEKNK